MNTKNTIQNSIYGEFFKMENLPFERDIPYDSLCKTTQFSDVLARLKYTVDNRQFAVLTGDIGTGKSTTLRALKESLDSDDYLVLYVSQNNITPRWLYSIPLEQLGYQAKMYVKDAKKQFQDAIKAETTLRHKKVVLILDEAHLVSTNKKYETLEEIRFLLNNDCDSNTPMALIIAGQNELWDFLNRDKYRAITRRINLICKIAPLNTEQVFDYISAHMQYSKAQDSIFTTEAIKIIADSSRGVPRVINNICKHCLIYAASKNEWVVSSEIAKSVIDNEIPACVLR